MDGETELDLVELDDLAVEELAFELDELETELDIVLEDDEELAFVLEDDEKDEEELAFVLEDEEGELDEDWDEEDDEEPVVEDWELAKLINIARESIRNKVLLFIFI